MCGFNGCTKKDEIALAHMSVATAHRGPDSTGFWHTNTLSLAHNRLAVIDVSASANQPMHSPDGRYVIVYNGEIYNFKELRRELEESWKFISQGDTEVLLAGYARWGKEVFSKVRGIFACAIYDRENDSVYLTRDHMGVKPLYYTQKDGVLYFSSELSGIIAGTNKRTLSRDALSYYITLNYVPSPYTLIEGVYKLRPGHALTYAQGVCTVERYWSRHRPENARADLHTLVSHIDHSVKEQLISDRDLGVFLSGGLDSSIVLHHTAAHSQQVRTFSVDYETPKNEEVKFNSDARLAEKTAKAYGALHTTFTLTLKDVRASLHGALSCLDEPIANPTSVSQYLLAQWVRKEGIVVALGGDGGDELFGGYTRHTLARAVYYYQKFPALLRRGALFVRPELHKLDTPFGTPLHMRLLALKAHKYDGIFGAYVSPEVVSAFFDVRYSEQHISELPVLDQFMTVDRESWLADESLARTDRTSMAFGVETRVPLLGIDVVSYADSLDARSKYSLFSHKKILKDAYAGVLPAYLFSQPKRGWLSPGSKWLRDEEVEAYVQATLSPHFYAGLNNILSWDAVAQMLHAHIHNKEYHIYPLWNILQLQVWAEKYKIIT